MPAKSALAFVACLALGCGKTHNAERCDPAKTPTPKSQEALPSTSAAIFVNNLHASVAAAKQLRDAQPNERKHCLSLNKALYTVGQYTGDPKRIQEAIHLLDACALLPTDGTPLSAVKVAKAAQLQTLHRFSQAREVLNEASPEGSEALANATDVARELAWNQGDYKTTIPAIRVNAERAPSAQSLARLALLEHALGNYDAADVAFDRAEREIKDTNPLTIAWLFVQRGHHHMELEEYALAESFFRAAVDRLPDYAAATEHLGEVLALQEKYEESVKMYEKTLQHSDNPEFMGALAGVYRAMGRTKEADQMREKARAGFLDLLQSFPEAMYGHGAEFFLEEGADPKRALELQTQNLALRPTSESWLGLAKAQLALNMVNEADVSIQNALAMPLISLELFETAAAIADKLGNKNASAQYNERAEKLKAQLKARKKLHCLAPAS